jgi:hypothetical protein
MMGSFSIIKNVVEVDLMKLREGTRQRWKTPKQGVRATLVLVIIMGRKCWIILVSRRKEKSAKCLSTIRNEVENTPHGMGTRHQSIKDQWF